MKKAVAIILLILGIVLIILSFMNSILPPGLTGIGFLALGFLFLKKEIIV